MTYCLNTRNLFSILSYYITVKAGTAKDGTVKDGTVKAGTVKAGTVNAGTVKAGTGRRGYIFYNQFDSDAEDLGKEASVFGFPRRGLLSPFSQEA